MPKKNSKSLYAVVLFLFLAGVGYLAVSGIAGSSAYYVDVAEALDMPLDKPKRVRLFGKVKDGYAKLEEGVGVRFQLEDKTHASRAIWTTYSGAVPDAFTTGAEIIVEGIYEGHDREFVATKLMTQCPSKYKKMQEQKSS